VTVTSYYTVGQHGIGNSNKTAHIRTLEVMVETILLAMLKPLPMLFSAVGASIRRLWGSEPLLTAESRESREESRRLWHL